MPPSSTNIGLGGWDKDTGSTEVGIIHSVVSAFWGLQAETMEFR